MNRYLFATEEKRLFGSKKFNQFFRKVKKKLRKEFQMFFLSELFSWRHEKLSKEKLLNNNLPTAQCAMKDADRPSQLCNFTSLL